MDDEQLAVVAEPRWVWPTVWVVFPLLGAGALWLLTLAAGWVASLPAAPLQPLFRLVDSAPEPVATVVAVVVGLVAGAAVAAVAQRDSLVVTVGVTELGLTRGERTARLPRVHVGAVFLDGKELVVLDRDGEELERWPNDRPAADLRRALSAHGYPWHESDPYHDRYRRWVPDLPDLPVGADALFAARQRALAAGDADEAAQLRVELGRLGLVVRDEGTRQFWRQVR